MRAAIWGSSFLFRRMGAVEFGPLPTAAVRVAIAALFLLPLVWLRGLLGWSAGVSVGGTALTTGLLKPERQRAPPR